MSVFRVKDKDGNIIEIPALVIGMNKKCQCHCALPKYIHVKVGNEFRIYFRNIISLKSARLWFAENYTNTTIRYYDDYLSIIANEAGTRKLMWKLYNNDTDILESGELTIFATDKNATGNTTVLIIGDSTAATGIPIERAQALYTADIANLCTIGTKGTAPALHEGHPGWSTASYFNNSEDNPFYNNGGFDFAHYMATQGYSGVQAVFIQLGINDIFPMKDEAYDSDAILERFGKMVESILAYDSNIKVIVNLPFTPNSNGTGFTETYGTAQIQWLYNRNIIRFARELKDYFLNHPGVTISATNCILDTKTDIGDGVHPNRDGYNKVGEMLYGVLVSLVDGVVNIQSLLAIDEREYVVHNTTTIDQTMERELNFGRCYTATSNGMRSSAQKSDTYEALGEDSLAYTSIAPTVARGVEFPVQLEVGKSYTLRYNANITGARVVLVKFNANTTYDSYTVLSSDAGNHSQTITPEAGYIYAIHFGANTAERCVWSNISLTEE